MTAIHPTMINNSSGELFLFIFNNCFLLKRLLGNLRRGLHQRLVVLLQPRNLRALVSQKLKAEDVRSQRSLQPRKQHLRPRAREKNNQPLRRNPNRHLKPHLSREAPLQKSPRHQLLKSWTKGGPSDLCPRSRPPRSLQPQRRRQGAGPSAPRPKSRLLRRLQLKSRQPRVDPNVPQSRPLQSPQWKRGPRAASSLLASLREGNTEPRSVFYKLGWISSSLPL